MRASPTARSSSSRPGSIALGPRPDRRGTSALERALALGGRGPYVLQAAIAALHVEEPQDWPQLAAVRRARPRHRVAGRRAQPAAAIAEAGDVEAALALVERLELDATTTCTRRARSCCAGSIASTTPAPPTTERSSSSTRTPSAASSSSGWRSYERCGPREGLRIVYYARTPARTSTIGAFVEIRGADRPADPTHDLLALRRELTLCLVCAFLSSPRARWSARGDSLRRRAR